MATDETDPDLPIPDQGRGAASWLSTLCAGRHLEIVGPSRHGPDAVDVVASMMGHDQELWVVAPCPLGAAALDRFKDLVPVMGGRLWHPNVWPIPDGGVYEGRPYLLVPRFAGDTLSERISDRSLPVAEADVDGATNVDPARGRSGSDTRNPGARSGTAPDGQQMRGPCLRVNLPAMPREATDEALRFGCIARGRVGALAIERPQPGLIGWLRRRFPGRAGQ